MTAHKSIQKLDTLFDLSEEAHSKVARARMSTTRQMTGLGLLKTPLLKKAIKKIDKKQMVQVEVKPSKIHGKGIFARKTFKRKAIIGLAMVKTGNTGDPDRDWTRLKLGRFLNFSSRPNAEAIVMAERLIFIQATKPIRKGQEVIVSAKMEFFK
jgi:SET domain-containing protein